MAEKLGPPEENPPQSIDEVKGIVAREFGNSVQIRQVNRGKQWEVYVPIGTGPDADAAILLGDVRIFLNSRGVGASTTTRTSMKKISKGRDVVATGYSSDIWIVSQSS